VSEGLARKTTRNVKTPRDRFHASQSGLIEPLSPRKDMSRLPI
jgi:hypothetical protein